MTKQERNAIITQSKSMTDKELEKAYYDSVFDTLGCEAERMYELGYDMADIKDREQHEKFLCQKSDLLQELCYERGIRLWEK